LHFDVAVFTNLSRDHLDLHGDMRSYFEAKKKLFAGLDGKTPRVLVLNADDPQFDELNVIAPSRVITYGLRNPAHIRPQSYQLGWSGTDAQFQTPAGPLPVRSKLMGTPNLYNISAAIGVAIGLGIPPTAVSEGISQLANVPGRFQPVEAGQPFRVIVDYAHTDDALEKILKSAREITAGKLIVVFGCGGERDRTKRPLMGEAAAHWSDFAIVTSDNPRGEDPLSIIREIEDGLKRAGAVSGLRYQIVADRREAIGFALRRAKAEDTVVVAGKGHENYQTIGSKTLPFDDRVVVKELLDELGAGRNH